MSVTSKHVLTAVSLAVACSFQAHAQQAQASNAGPGMTITITAQKRQQAAERVPVSVYATSAADLERAGIDSMADLDHLAAGLTIAGANPGQYQLAIRGITTIGGVLSTAIGYYVDETPFAAAGTAMPEVALWDIERVEVLRGPQGTLFGEGSMGGTIRVITRKPDLRALEGRVQAGYESVAGGQAGWQARGVINVPLAKDVLALRVQASRKSLLGWVDVPALALKDVNDGRQEDARIAARWKPLPATTVDLSHTTQRLGVGDAGATAPGVLDPAAVFPGAGNPAFASRRELRYDLSALTVQHDLGPATLVLASSRFRQRNEQLLDKDPLAPLFFGPLGAGGHAFVDGPYRTNSSNHEVRLVSNGRRTLDWTVGFYAKDEDLSQTATWNFDLPNFYFPLEERSTLRADFANRGKAVFADFNLALTPAWALQLGGRHYRETRQSNQVALTDSIVFSQTAGTEQPSTSRASVFSPKVGFSWQATERLMVYGKVANGFTGGGGNYVPPNQPNVPASFAPEKIRSLELGVKSRPTGWMTLAAAVYRNNWTNLQLPLLTPDGLFAFTGNAGRAVSTGAELEIAAQPSSALRLGLNLGTSDATIREDVIDALGQAVAAKGNRIPLTPRFSAAITAAYSFELLGGLGATASAAYSHRGANYTTIGNTADERNGAADLLNLRLSVQGRAWTATAYLNNALDSTATSFSTRPATLVPLIYKSYVQPRTIGVSVDYAF